jgi:rubrerythrin
MVHRVAPQGRQSDLMRNQSKDRLMNTLQNFLEKEVQADERYEKAIELASYTGFSEVALGLMQMRKDAKNHKEALELMLLGVELE